MFNAGLMGAQRRADRLRPGARLRRARAAARRACGSSAPATRSAPSRSRPTARSGCRSGRSCSSSRKTSPKADAGHAVGLYLIAWGIFTAYMFVASLRTTAAIALVFVLLTATFFAARHRRRGRHTTSITKAGRLHRARDGGRGLVRLVRGGDELDVRADRPAGQATAAALNARRRRSRPRRRSRRWPPRRRARDRSSSELERAAGAGDVRAAGGVRRAGAASPTRRSTRRRTRTPRAGGSKQAEALHWFAEVGHGARRVQPAVLQVVRGRQAQRVLQLPRPPRRGRQRRPRGVPLARRGGRGARRHLRRPAPRRPAVRQRAEGPRRRARATSSGSSCR